VADKIQIGLDDRTAQGAQSVAANLDRIDEATAKLAERLEALTASSQEVMQAQEQVVRVVTEEQAAWSKMATVGVGALASVTTAGIEYAATLAKIQFANDLLAKGQQALLTGAQALAKSQQALNIALDIGEKAAVRGAAGLAGYGAAAGSVLSVLSGLTIGLKAYQAVWDATGRTVDEETGKITTNADRVNSAFADLTSDVQAFGAGAAEVARQGVADLLRQLDEFVPLATLAQKGWAEFDASVTRSVDQMVENMRLLGSAIRGVERDAVEASERIAAAQAESVDDFERVRQANDALAAAAEARAEAERVASIQTTQAIDDEIAKLKERRGIAAANNQFDEASQQKFLADMDALESRRKQIAEAEKQRRDAARREDEQRAIEAQQYQDQIVEDAIDRHNEQVMRENEASARAHQQQLEDWRKLQSERMRIFLDAEARMTAEAKKQADERLAVLRAEHEARVKMIQDAEGIGGQKLLDQARQAIDPRAVRQQIAQQRGQQAAEQFTRERAGDLDASDAAAVRRFRAQREVARQQAERAAAQQFNRGQVNPEEIGRAQTALIQSAAQQAVASGNLSEAMGRALMEAANNQQAMTERLNRQEQQIQQVTRALQGVGQSNASARQRAISGGFRR